MADVIWITILGKFQNENRSMGKLSFLLCLVLVCVFCLALPTPSRAAPFAVFPQAGRLVSPDGRFEVRDVEQGGAAGEFVGTFRALWVVEIPTGRSRKLCDYLGVAAVAWSENHAILITQYVGKKSSRALIFPEAGATEGVMLDSGTLIQLLPVEWRPPLRENDHLFVEATGLEGETFRFRVWGYGKHDPNGFRWNCGYSLGGGTVLCEAATKAKGN